MEKHENIKDSMRYEKFTHHCCLAMNNTVCQLQTQHAAKRNINPDINTYKHQTREVNIVQVYENVSMT